MSRFEKPIQPGFEKVQSPDVRAEEQYAETVDQAFTTEVEGNDDVIREKEQLDKMEEKKF